MKLAGDSANIGEPANSVGGGVCQMRMMRSASANGSGFKTTAFTTVKMAEFTPIPRPRINTPASAKPRLLLNVRTPYRRSRINDSRRRQAAAIAVTLLRLLDAPERDQRAPARFVGVTSRP